MNTKNKCIDIQDAWESAKNKSTIDAKIADEMSAAIQRAIDWDILSEMLEQMGWTKVEFTNTNSLSTQKTEEIKEWNDVNCQGKVKSYDGAIWMFEHSKDAVLFTLRWL